MTARRVLILSPAHPLRGGIAASGESLCRAFLAAGHEAEILSYSRQYPEILFPGKTQLSEDGEAPWGLAIHSLIDSINPINWLGVGRWIRDWKPDFIVVRFWLPFMGPCLGSILRLAKAGPLAAGRPAPQVIALVDNIIPHESRPGDRPFTQYFAGACDGFVAMSQPVLKDLEQFSTSPHKILAYHPNYESYGEPVPKSEARKYLGWSADSRILLFFGLIRRYKGLDLLIEAMADPRLKALGVHLMVAGEFYEPKADYEAQIRRLGLEGAVTLIDRFIPNSEVKHYFSASDMIAQTYRSATQSGVTAVAVQFERPALVTAVGGLADALPHGRAGYVVAPEPAAIAAAIADFYENDREAAFSKAMAAEKPKYSWEGLVLAIDGLYQSMVRAPAHA